MNRTNLPWFIAAALVIIIILMIIFGRGDPKPELQKQAYQTQIAILEAEKATIQSRQEQIVKRYSDKIKVDSVKLAAKDVEIKAIKARVVIKRIIVQPLIDSIPTLRAFVELQDSLIQVQGQQIDTLKQAYASQIQTTEDLIQNHDAQERISQRIEAEKDKRIEALEKQNRRKNRGVKFWKVATVVSLVGGFFLGSQ